MQPQPLKTGVEHARPRRGDAARLAECTGGASSGRQPKSGRLITRGCDGGDLKSCTDLGALHLSGTGVDANPGVAAAYFEAACDRSWPSACHYLAVQHLLGNGVAKNLEKAVALNTTACDGGVAPACGHIGGMHKLGYGVPPNAAASIRYQRRRARGELFSCSLTDKRSPGRRRAG